MSGVSAVAVCCSALLCVAAIGAAGACRICFGNIGCCSVYEVATIRRLLEFIGLFCKILSLLQGSFAKETCVFKEPTNHSHPSVYEVATISRLLEFIGLLCRT